VLVATALSGGLASFVGYGGLVWHPQFLQEAKGMSDSQIAIFYAIVLGVTGIIGTFSGGWFVDLLSRRDRRWSAWLPAGAFAMSIPLWVGLLWAPSWPLALVFVGGVALLMSMYSAPALALTQNRSAPAQRTISGAIMLLIMNLMGMGTGPLFVGWIADTFADKGDLSLVYGYAALVPFIGLTVVAYLFTANLIHRTAAPKAA
jgi:MFS family permease